MRDLARFRTHLASGLLCVLWLSGCGGGSSSPAPASNPPPGILLGTSGGSVATSDGKLTLSVAAGALSGDTRFTLAAVDGIDGLPSDYVLVPGTVYQVDWSGAGFGASSEVALRIADPSAAAATANSLPGAFSAALAVALHAHALGGPPLPSSAVVHCADGTSHIVALDPGDPGYGNASISLCPPSTQGSNGTPSTSHTTVGVVKPAPGRFPSITAQPASTSANVGDSVSFSVTASATAALSYQWRRNGVDIAGANASSYHFVATLADDGASYAVLVSNAYGQLQSAAATLTIQPAGPPSITRAPLAASSTVGGTASFSVAAQGAGPLIYQWSLNGAPLSDRTASGSASGIAGSQAANLTLDNVQTGDAGNYTVVVSNGQGPDATANADLQVSAAPPSSWTQLQGAPWAVGNAIALDATGNVYVVGWSSLTGNGGDGDIFITKYNAAGSKQWSRQLGGAGTDMAMSVAIDSTGHVLVAGTTAKGLDGNATVGMRDGFIAKFDADGNRQWTRQFGGAADDVPQSVAIDGADGIYIAGYTFSAGLSGQPGTTANASAFLTKYGADGSVVWTNVWHGTDATQAYGVAADASGVVRLVGAAKGSVDGQAHTAGTPTGDYDVFVTAFDAGTGARRWTTQWGSIQLDFGKSIAIDPAGNSYVTGITYGAMHASNAGGPKVFLTKLSPAGAIQWGSQLAVLPSYSLGVQVVLDAQGSAYVGGTANAAQAGGSLFVTRFDASGIPQATYLHGTDASVVTTYGMAINGHGQGYVCGSVSGGPFDGDPISAGGYDAFVHSFALP